MMETIGLLITVSAVYCLGYTNGWLAAQRRKR
jgi:hypothetical protein